MVLRVGIADFRPLHVDFYNAKPGIEVGVLSIDGETVDGFVVRHRLAVERRDVGDVAVEVNEVDVGILINGNEAFDLFVPGNMGDVRVA